MKTSLAQGNARRIGQILEDRAGSADLYRTITAGPSGQRRDLLIARVRYVETGPWEVEIINVSPGSPNRGDVAGYARRADAFEAVRRPGAAWSVHGYDDWDGIHWLGYSSSLSLGCDVAINGVHAATGRHDSRRISGGTWLPNTKEHDRFPVRLPR